MPKVQSFKISPLKPGVSASLEALGQKIVAGRKAQGISQKDMATRVGISPQTMLFIEHGRPNVQIGHYARALSVLGSDALAPEVLAASSSVLPRSDALRQHLPSKTISSAPTPKLEFAYNWSNAQMADDTLIRKVIDKGRFNDLAVICKRYGLDHVRKIAGDKLNSSPRLRRALSNIAQGFARERSHSP